MYYLHVLVVPIFVHSWGGLGSQLFALAFALDLERTYPNRLVTICHHSSGVTKREFDLPTLDTLGIRSKFVDDFVPMVDSSKADLAKHSCTETKRNSRFVANLRSVLDVLGLVITTDPPDSLLRPWSVQVRSSYSNRRISDASLSKLVSLLVLDDKPLRYAETFTAHLRMGDLITLTNKGPLDGNRVVGAMKRAAEENSELRILVTSDSPELISKVLDDANFFAKYDIFDGNALDTLIVLSSSRVMVASASKLSIWAILIGIELNLDRIIFIPQELSSTIETMVRNRGRTKFIIF